MTDQERDADSIAGKILTDLELSGITIQPANRWREVKLAYAAALLEARKEGMEEAAKIASNYPIPIGSSDIDGLAINTRTGIVQAIQKRKDQP